MATKATLIALGLPIEDATRVCSRLSPEINRRPRLVIDYNLRTFVLVWTRHGRIVVLCQLHDNLLPLVTLRPNAQAAQGTPTDLQGWRQLIELALPRKIDTTRRRINNLRGEKERVAAQANPDAELADLRDKEKQLLGRLNSLLTLLESLQGS